MYFMTFAEAMLYVEKNGLQGNFCCKKQEIGEHKGWYKVTAFDDNKVLIMDR